MPPVHPAIVHFPIALLTLSVFADLFGYIYPSSSLKAVGWWSLIVAAVSGVLAVVAGYLDMKREDLNDAAHKKVHTHMKIGFILLALIAGLTIWRWVIYSNPDYAIGLIYIIVGFLVLGLAGFQGWLGSELVYGYGVGVAPTGQGTEPAHQAKERVEKVVGESDSDKHEH